MRFPTYRYNPTTCRYEPVPFKAKDVLIPLFLFLSITASLFVGLLILQGIFFTTDKEKNLKHENNALAYHYHQLSNELSTVKASLVLLGDADKNIQRKLVNDKTPELALQLNQAETKSKRRIETYELLKKAKLKTTTLLEKASSHNYYFANSIQVDSKDLTLLMNVPSIQPVENKELTKLTSGFGVRTNPFHKRDYFHSGIDFVAPRGTSVFASAAGKVTEVRKSDLPMGDGNVIEIDHGNGFKSRYAHLGEILVKPGQRVTKGAVIASIGMTGGSVSPHLHFEIFKNNKQVDPVSYLIEGVSSADYTSLLLLAKQKNQSLD